MSVVPKKLAILSPNASPDFFFCDNVNCTKSFTKCTTEIIDEEGEYEWLVGLQCSKCKTVWWICRHCRIRKKMTTRQSMSRHQYSRHTKHETSPTKRKHNIDDNPFRNRTDNDIIDVNEGNVLDFDNEKNVIIDVDLDDDTKLPAKDNGNDSHNDHLNDVDHDVIRKMRLSYFLKVQDDKKDCIRSNMIDHFMKENIIHKINENMSNYYSHDISSSGKKYLITKMWCKEESTTHDVFGRISEEEVNTQIKISKFAQSLTRGQQQDFSEVLNDINDVYFEKK